MAFDQKSTTLWLPKHERVKLACYFVVGFRTKNYQGNPQLKGVNECHSFPHNNMKMRRKTKTTKKRKRKREFHVQL